MLAFIGFLEFICVLGILVGAVLFATCILKKNRKRKPIITIGISFASLVLLTVISSVFFSEEMENQRLKRELIEIEKKKEYESKKTKKQEEKKSSEKKEGIKNNNKENEKKEKNNEIKEKEFAEIIKKYVDNSVAEKANDILVNQIGFSEVKFEGQLAETSNFEIWVDGTKAILTASDDVYRIFIPETDFVFYENGQVVMNAQQFSDKTMDISEQSAYYIIAKEIVNSALKNPSSADYPSITFSPQEIAIKKSGELVVVQSYVDAQNGFGAMIRTNYTVEFRVVDINSFSYELVYANIDGNVTGTYIEI